MKNDNTVSNQKLYHILHEYEGPLAQETYIRKYNSSQQLETDTLRTFIEKTFYGQTGGSLCENGWFYAGEYDKNGRSTYVWHPFDFPPDGTGIHYSELEECVPLHSAKTVKKVRTDTLIYATKDVRYGGGWATHYDESALYVGNSYGKALPFDSIDAVETANLINVQNSTIITYVPSSYDAIHNATSIQKAYLRLNPIGHYINECLTLKIKIPGLNFEKYFTVGCPALALLPDACTSVQKDNKLPEFRIDLMSIIDSLKNAPLGVPIDIEISSQSAGGMLELPNYSTDALPCIGIQGIMEDPHADYTFHYVYDDSSRTTLFSAKIDDSLHTANNNTSWGRTRSTHDDRYTEALGYFGPFNNMFRLNSFIGNPTSPARIDSVVSKFSGFGFGYEFKDQEGNIFESSINTRLEMYKSTAPDDSYKEVNRDWGLPETFISGYDTTDQNFYGFCTKVTGKDELMHKNISYYDFFGRLRRTEVDSGGFALITKYEYDESGNLKKVIGPTGDTTKYWYDNFGRVIYKHHKDVDFISYAYDKIGQLRFTQTKKQADENKVSYFEYDDLGRTTVTGEAVIDITGLDPAPAEPVENNGVWTFNRLTDILADDDYVNNLNIYPTTDTIYTANKTLWATPSAYPPYIDFSVDEKTTIPPLSDFPDEPTPAAPYMYHATTYWDYAASINAAAPNAFENIADNHRFVRTVTNYDKFPYRSGAVWGNIPALSEWETLTPLGSLKNLKGSEAAAAYRNEAAEPFHYVVMSYDPRGRVEAIMRYTENLGFDAVYYTYNSANEILTVKIADPVRTHMTWYSYDNNGRVDTVWTKLGASGSGLGMTSPDYPADLTKPTTPDIVNFYGKRGNADSIRFVPVDVTQFMKFNTRGMLDSLTARNSCGFVIFREKLTRNAAGNITEQISQHTTFNQKTWTYAYDRLQRLVRWEEGTRWQKFGYDNLSNRLADTVYDGSTTTIKSYIYSQTNPNMLSSISTDGNTTSSFSYDVLGSLIERSETGHLEQFEYNAGGLINRFKVEEGENMFDWRYRYSILGGREQKRMYDSKHGASSEGNSHAWEYNLLGAGGELLAVYHGRQTSEEEYSSGEGVFFYPSYYISAGGMIKTRIFEESGNNVEQKDFHITDHIGSVRSVVSYKNQNVSIKGYDYKPFGENDWNSGGSDPKEHGFTGAGIDIESRYSWFGVRQYDPQMGRFLSVDPLFEIFPENTPYCYAYNSPLVNIDPTGMATLALNIDPVYGKVIGFLTDTAIAGPKPGEEPVGPPRPPDTPPVWTPPTPGDGPTEDPPEPRPVIYGSPGNGILYCSGDGIGGLANPLGTSLDKSGSSSGGFGGNPAGRIGGTKQEKGGETPKPSLGNGNDIGGLMNTLDQMFGRTIYNNWVNSFIQTGESMITIYGLGPGSKGNGISAIPPIVSNIRLSWQIEPNNKDGAVITMSAIANSISAKHFGIPNYTIQASLVSQNSRFTQNLIHVDGQNLAPKHWNFIGSTST